MLLDEISLSVINHRVDIYGGTLALCEVLSNKAIFMAVGINVDTKAEELALAVQEKFGGEVESLESLSDKQALAFSRHLEGPLYYPKSLLLSTQRKFLEVIDELSRNAAEKSLMSGD